MGVYGEPGFWFVMRDCSGIGHGAGGDILFLRQYLLEGGVHPIHDGLLGAKIDCECQWCQTHAANTFVTCA